MSNRKIDMNSNVCDVKKTEILEPSVKAKIMDFFVNCRCDEIWVSSMPIVDCFTDQPVNRYIMAGRPVSHVFFYKTPYVWTSEDVYHFDKYDVQLYPDFKEYAINYSKQSNEEGMSLIELFEKLAKERKAN